MKIVNIMNFLRQTEPRDMEVAQLLEFHAKSGVCNPNVGEGLGEDERRNARIKEAEKGLFETARLQYDLALRTKLPTTFLLQYDCLCDERYVNLFKNAPDFCEIGVWYEIVKPMAEDAGLEYKSKMGWAWDWHIEPGLPMSYTLCDREKLAKVTMEKFKEVFGRYPRTLGGWLVDTHTVNYLNDNYELDAICICRDQVNTDAYTLVGGYFNQGYFPSRENMFTPAKSESLKNKTPIIRLLGPDPIHNYDSKKYISDSYTSPIPVFTMECASPLEPRDKFVEWYVKNTFDTEDMGFSYTHIGQENSFGMYDLISPTEMRIEKIKKYPDVKFLTMGETGRAMTEKYGTKTPVSANLALDNWDERDIQTAYYNCENYVINLLRLEDRAFIRALYLFDEACPDMYTAKRCDTFDAVYENQPVVETIRWQDDFDAAWYLDAKAGEMTAEKISDTALKVSFGAASVLMDEWGIEVSSADLVFNGSRHRAKMSITSEELLFEYRGNSYSVKVVGGAITREEELVRISPVADKFTLLFVIK